MADLKQYCLNNFDGKTVEVLLTPSDTLAGCRSNIPIGQIVYSSVSCPSNSAFRRATLCGHGLLGSMRADQVPEASNRRAVAQRGVASTPVLLDVPEQVGLRIGSCRVHRAVHRSFLRLLKNLSVDALHQQLPLRLIKAAMTYSLSFPVMPWLADWLPRWRRTLGQGAGQAADSTVHAVEKLYSTRGGTNTRRQRIRLL